MNSEFVSLEGGARLNGLCQCGQLWVYRCGWLRNMTAPTSFSAAAEIRGCFLVMAVAGCSYATAILVQVSCGSVMSELFQGNSTVSRSALSVVFKLTLACQKSELQGCLWFFVRSTLLPYLAQLSHEQKPRSALSHRQWELHLKISSCTCE